MSLLRGRATKLKIEVFKIFFIAINLIPLFGYYTAAFSTNQKQFLTYQTHPFHCSFYFIEEN